MSNHVRFLHTMRSALDGACIAEVSAAGEFILPSVRPILFPGAVYGFATQLSDDEKQRLFDEAKSRQLNRLKELTDFKPIEGDLYPIYWGKDKQLGSRPHQHLKDPKKTGAIRLGTYKSLVGKTIACVSLTVVDFEAAERALQTKFPHLLKTTTKKFED